MENNKDQTKKFTGHLTLNRIQQGWIIDGNSYKSVKKDDAEEYLRKNNFTPSSIITDKIETKQHTAIVEPLQLNQK
ncbi:MAG: hypothetical protein MZV65_15345 [Chromatiales bacterium]|nr:hypothetical protein [Chromatiales bacterium]